MTDNIDRLSAIQAEHLYVVLIGVMDRARANVDATAVAGALERFSTTAPTDEQLAGLDAALGFDTGYLEALLAKQREDDAAYLDDGLAGFFVAVVALASAAIGYAGSTSNGTVLADRERYLSTMRAAYLGDTARAVIETVRRMATAPGSITSRTRQVLRTIGLSPGQATSLDAARQALFAFLSDPTKATPRAIVDRLASRLSAPQRAMLTKAMTPALDETAAEKLLSRHANKLADYRARTASREQTHALTERAKLTAWQVAQRVGFLPRDQRRFWQTAGDERVRHSHAAVPGMNAAGVPLDKPFATPLGECMAPPLEIGCRCKAILKRVP